MINFILAIGFLLQTGTSSLKTVEATMGPLLTLALVLDAAVVACWYFIGSLLNNNRVKGAALGEFYQFIGTAIMVAIIVGSLAMVAGIFYTSYSATSLMSQKSLSVLCANVMTTTQFNVIGSSNSLLSGTQTAGGVHPGICTIINRESSATASLTNRISYPLAAAGVVMANLTNQTVANLNYAFVIDAWLGFLSQFKPTVNICLAPSLEGTPCIIPNPFVSPTFLLEYSDAPYAGYSLLLSNMGALATILNLSVESFVAQLLFITIFMYVWPWILFGGFVLRSTMFTRRLGGMLIAVVLAGLFIYPAVFSIEYLALGNGFSIQSSGVSGNYIAAVNSTLVPRTFQQTGGNIGPTGYNTTYGFNAVTNLPATPVPPWQPAGKTPASGNYVINFFVEPNIKAITWAYGCWPNEGGKEVSLLSGEADDITEQLIPLAGILTEIKYDFQTSFSSSLPNYNLPAYCPPQAALDSFYAMLNSYGIIGLVSFLLPLINIVITVTSVTGLSELFGGDTSLAGLSRIL